ncbi:hypothetical protein INS49_008576 [Diaporthe citri]|uniref:uncharacterized protein n=1 Tax=Diaporthe citri TaxID=83186 RepID=UPI001C7F9918|nr:uncharacterized protein INS49_008576 [Diaporthe citri]KAG6363476.1 hypothetical protein INS49_008576 [Diaporthe citri]
MSEEDEKKCTPRPIVPHIPECEPIHEFDDFVAFLNRKCSGPQSNALSHIPENANSDSSDSGTVETADHSSFSLEQRGVDEPYHPSLKPIYDDCNVLGGPGKTHNDSGSGRVDELSSQPNTIDNDLLDEIFDTDGVVPVADDDDLPRRPQVTAAPEATQAAWPIEGFPWVDLEPFFQECEHADGFDSLEDCVYEKMREDVCSSNPGDESCQVPRATLINERDLPLYTKAAALRY